MDIQELSCMMYTKQREKSTLLIGFQISRNFMPKYLKETGMQKIRIAISLMRDLFEY